MAKEIIKIKNFYIENNNGRVEIGIEGRKDKGILVVEKTITEKEMKIIKETLTFNDNWDMIIYLLCDSLVNTRIKYK